MSDLIEREIERAWAQHDPRRARIPSEIRRRVRQFKKELVAPAAIIGRSLTASATRQAIADFSRKGQVGKLRALVRLKKAFPGAVFRIDVDTIEARWLEPCEAIIADPRTPGEAQDCILVHFFVGGPRTRRSTGFMSVFALEVPDHALCRVWQRDSAADLRAVLYEAAEHFLQADRIAVVEHVRAGRTLYLKGGAGLFPATAIKSVDGSGRRSIYCRPRTWLAPEMIRDDQVPIAVAEHADDTVWATVQLMAEGQSFEASGL